MSSPRAPAWLRCRVVETQLDEVIDRLAAEAAPERAAPEPCRHLLKSPGKCLRAVLLLLSAQFGHCPQRNILSLALAIELLHTATLYHDDVLDCAAVRRGVATPSRRWGDPAAVFTGGYLLSRSIELFAEGGAEVSRLASRSVERLWKGQMEEIENTGNLSMPIGRYQRIVLKKTGALFELPCRLGSRVTGATDAHVFALGRFGRKLGTAFQLADDLSDLLAHRSTLGKDPGTDLREGVYTLPLIHCARQATSDSLALEGLLLDAGPHPPLHEVCAILRRSGSITFTKHLIFAGLQSAQAAIAVLPPIDARESLFSLTHSIENSVASFV